MFTINNKNTEDCGRSGVVELLELPHCRIAAEKIKEGDPESL